MLINNNNNQSFREKNNIKSFLRTSPSNSSVNNNLGKQILQLNSPTHQKMNSPTQNNNNFAFN